MSHHLPRAWRLTFTAGLAAFIAVPAAWTSPAWASAATSHTAPMPSTRPSRESGQELTVGPSVVPSS